MAPRLELVQVIAAVDLEPDEGLEMTHEYHYGLDRTSHADLRLRSLAERMASRQFHQHLVELGREPLDCIHGRWQQPESDSMFPTHWTYVQRCYSLPRRSGRRAAEV